MIKKFLNWLRKVKYRWFYSRCYAKMEYNGKAAMDCCDGLVGGDKLTEYLQYSCVDCPYFVDVLQIVSKELNGAIEKTVTDTLRGGPQ